MYRYGNMLDAIIDFKMAETIAEHADDKELKSHVYDILHHVNIISHNHYQTLRYAHKWLDNSTALKDSVMILKNLLICANAYADINQMDSAHAYLNRTIELAKQTDSSLLPNIYATAYRKSGFQSLARIKKSQIQAYDDSMKYVNRAMQMIDRQQKFDEVRQTKEFNHRLSWMQGLTTALMIIVAIAVGVGLWWHRRKVHRLSQKQDEDAQRISHHRTKIEELENRMEHISSTLLVGTQMFNQLQQRQSIAEATAKEQQCLVDYFSQLRPKRWQEWQRKYNSLSTAQYIFLIMQDDLHYDDEAIANALNVKRTSVRSMRSRIKSRAR
jgi:hypothetical protein